MNLFIGLVVLSALTGISSADTVCQTSECKKTADLITTSIDSKTDPCDDFYEYSCGTWKKNNPITAADVQNGVSHFEQLTVQLLKNLLNALEKGSVATDPTYLHPLINFYKGCSDTKTRDSHEKRDFDEIRSILKKLGGWPLIDGEWDAKSYDIETAFIELNKLFLSKVILDVEVMSDLKNNSLLLVSLQNPFTSSGVYEGIYRHPPTPKEHKPLEPLKEFFVEYYAENPIQAVAEALKGSAISVNEWTKDMTEVQDLDTTLRSVETPINDANYVIQHYDEYKITAKDLSKYSALNYRAIIDGVLKQEGIQLNDNDLVFVDKEYLEALEDIFADESNKRAIANLIGANLGVILNRFTSTRMALLTGVPAVEYVPQVCLSFAQQLIPDLLGRLYYDKLFDSESVADMKDFIGSLKQAFQELLEENQWMDKQTKDNALKKLNAISENIAFPDYMFNITQLQDFDKSISTFSADNFLASMLTGIGRERSLNSRALRNPEPPGHWPDGTNSVVVNAFYNPEVNGIFFPAGIAQFPFYQHTLPKPLNLGAIGMVISHELTHAFDNTGSLFDEKGNLRNWFSNSSRNIFNQKAECFVEQYNKFQYKVGSNTLKLNGLRTLGENIADNGGIRIAYRALELYKKKNAGKESKLPGSLNTLSDEKLFFLSFANIWCSNKGAQALTNQIQNDVHSVEDARVIATLSNFPEFSTAFNCKAGSRMNPTNKCVLWG